MRAKILGLLLFGLALPALAQQPPVPEVSDHPQVLASIVKREFLYSVGLSEPGALGVGSVRYQLAVRDAWHLAELPDTPLQVLTPGGCLALMRPGEHYLISLKPSLRDGESYWSTSCEVLPEKEARDAIARLNQARQLQASAF